jgi:hypothetical protein
VCCLRLTGEGWARGLHQHAIWRGVAEDPGLRWPELLQMSARKKVATRSADDGHVHGWSQVIDENVRAGHDESKMDC